MVCSANVEIKNKTTKTDRFWFFSGIFLTVLMLVIFLNITTSQANDVNEWMPSSPVPNWLAVYGNVDKPGPHPSAAVIGLIQAGYVDSSNNPGQFKIFKFRPGIVGTITDNLSFYTVVEFASNPVTAPTSGGGRLLDASATWSLKPVRIQIGQTVMPFATDATPAGAVPWIDYSDVVKNIYLKTRVTDSKTTAGRELGVMAWQEFKKDKMSFTYFLAALNGTGLSQNDDNNNKDIMAYLKGTYGPMDVGGAYWTGKTNLSGSDLSKNKYDVHFGFGNYAPASKDRVWGLVEYMKTNEKQPAGDDLKADGWQAALGVRPIQDTMFTYRYSIYNNKPATGSDNKITMHSIIGQYFIPQGKGTRLMVQYDFRDNKLNSSDKNALWVQLSIPFAATIFGGK